MVQLPASERRWRRLGSPDYKKLIQNILRTGRARFVAHQWVVDPPCNELPQASKHGKIIRFLVTGWNRSNFQISVRGGGARNVGDRSRKPLFYSVPAQRAAVVNSAQHCSPHTIASCRLRGNMSVGCRQLACHTRLQRVHSVPFGTPCFCKKTWIYV